MAFPGTLVHSKLDLLQWNNGHLEVVAASVATNKGWVTVAVCYNSDGAALYQEFNHYLSILPPPVILMGDFNAQHQCWEPDLPLHLTNTSRRAIFQVLSDSSSLSLLSPPGLLTGLHPHNGAASVLSLFIGDTTFSNTVISTGLYMGRDHLPVIASVPDITARPYSKFLSHWKLTPSGWSKLKIPLALSPLPLEETAESLTRTPEEERKAAFHLTTHHSSHRFGKSWWNEECTQAV